jgi:hypothetical protein
MATLTVDPLIPFPLWLLLVLLGATLLTSYARVRPAGITVRRWIVVLTLMAGGLALVLGVLLNPTWLEPVTPPAGKPLLTFLVDKTASMATPDVGGRSRYQLAAATARASAAELARRFDVRMFTFADSTSLVDPEALASQRPDGLVTDLARALSESIEPNRPQGQAVVLLSDGIHNAGPAERVMDALRLAKALSCPVYTRTYGAEFTVRDLALELRTSQELAYVGQEVPIAVLLKQRGLRGAEAHLHLLLNDKAMDHRHVKLGPDETCDVTFSTRQDQPGLYRYEVRADSVPGEMNLANNSATFLLRVVDEPLRVLLLEGKPYWDAKFLARTMLADPSVELDSVVRLSDTRLLRKTSHRAKTPAPRGRDAASIAEDWKIISDTSAILSDASLHSYQVILLGRDAEVFLTDRVIALLRNWLWRDAGSLVCFRGPPVSQVNQQLERLLPLHWTPTRETRYQLHLTREGRSILTLPTGQGVPDALLSQLPTLATSARTQRRTPLSAILAAAPAADKEEAPLVTTQPYGSGRVVVIEGAGMWRWAFLPPQGQQADDVYRSLWQGLLRWLASNTGLAPGQKLALHVDQATFATTEEATATLLARDDALKDTGPAVELQGNRMSRPTLFTPIPVDSEMRTFRIAFGKLPEGRYQARVIGQPAAVIFDVRNLSDETLDLRPRSDLMERIAHETGGTVLDGEKVTDVVAQLHNELNRAQPGRVRRLPAWDRWWVLAGIIATWTAAWAVRRSSGLV